MKKEKQVQLVTEIQDIEMAAKFQLKEARKAVDSAVTSMIRLDDATYGVDNLLEHIKETGLLELPKSGRPTKQQLKNCQRELKRHGHKLFKLQERVMKHFIKFDTELTRTHAVMTVAQEHIERLLEN